MDTVEKISVVIPKLKYQLMFLKEREALMSTSADGSMNVTQPLPISSPISSQRTSSVQGTFDRDAASNQSSTESKSDDQFPEKYVIPPLPDSLMKDIEDGLLNKFGPHYSNRQIMIDAITYNLVDEYKLL